jgi:glycogen debranching enzyme
MADSVSETILLSTESKQIETDLNEEKDLGRTTYSTPITLKSGDAFLVADVRGDFLASSQETGLFWHGTRFLRTCNLTLEGRPLLMLSHHVAETGNACQVDLTNYAFTADHVASVEQGVIHISRYLELRPEELVQIITVTSFYTVPVPLTLLLKIGADFRDIFEVRGRTRAERGTLRPPTLANNNILTFSYQGLDDVLRDTQLLLSPHADLVHADSLSWNLQLKRHQPIELRITVRMNESSAPQSKLAAENVGTHLWHDLPEPELRTNDPLFNQLLMRGMHDIVMLSTTTPYGQFPYAGIPWFCSPFGRDGLIASLQFLPWFPQVARGTLAFLAAHQGTKVEPFTEEEPGKMLHEMRMGEMANCREVPYIPYYGSIDVTPLFLITLAEYVRWSNDLPFLAQHWSHARAAARWLTDYGDRDGDGFIEYQKASEKGLGNQGWKDAWDAISHSDGRLVTPPVALCEVQGYAYAAYRAMSYLAGRQGKTQEAQAWEQRAATLREQFLRSFWWEEEQVFYLALNGAKEPCDVVSSNTGQCLWSGIVPEEMARPIVARLMREDMYSGWGLRTLSTQAQRYNPMSYHNGSVWPHDTAMVGAGFARYGGKAEAGTLLKGMYLASLYFERARLPELYCGFAQKPGYGPTRYPVACSPQAWAAGAPFMLVNALLGFEPDAEHGSLTLRHPTLPEWLQHLELSGLFVGDKHVHLRCTRTGSHTEVVVGADNEATLLLFQSQTG